MSKIQDALGKIQGKNVAAAKKVRSFPDIEDSIVLAKLTRHDGPDEAFPNSSKSLRVDSEALRQAGLIAPEYHEQLLADQYRDIKRPLIAHAFGKRATKIEGGNLIMVSSAMSGEGKTFTSINLAFSLANERDYSVLLVDADVAKPHTSQMFGAAEEDGLLDCLEDPSRSVRSLVLPTDVKNLSILPAGHPRDNATELLASAAMESVCETLQQMNERQLVILDSPPLLQTSEAKTLATLAGQVVMVVRAEETSRDAVTSALATIDEDKAVNLILNQARDGFGDYRYGYGYGYGYGKSSDRYSKAKDSSSKRAAGGESD